MSANRQNVVLCGVEYYLAMKKERSTDTSYDIDGP